MLKHLELSDPKSCMSRARPDEIVFVLLGRDAAAPAAIYRWCEERVRLGRNQRGDAQIVEAMECAMSIERELAAAASSANSHPTVKPTALMRYLLRLVTLPGGITLDPFFGSGSTGKAAVAEGFSVVGITDEAEHVAIARARLDHAMREAGHL